MAKKKKKRKDKKGKPCPNCGARKVWVCGICNVVSCLYCKTVIKRTRCGDCPGVEQADYETRKRNDCEFYRKEKPMDPKVTKVVDMGIQNYQRAFRCELENDGSPESKKFFLFKFYDDELSFTTEELVGLTERECSELFHRRDIKYLQS